MYLSLLDKSLVDKSHAISNDIEHHIIRFLQIPTVLVQKNKSAHFIKCSIMILYNPSLKTEIVFRSILRNNFRRKVLSNRDNKTKLLVTTALLTALVLICTLLLKIPVGPDCYIHLGDAVILLAVILLPRPYACFAGSVGATLADLMGGFAFWAPWTFVVKLTFVLIFGIFLDRSRKLIAKQTGRSIQGSSTIQDSSIQGNANTQDSSIQGNANTQGSETAARTIAGIPAIEFIGLIISGLVAVIGYFLAEYMLFGAWLPAATCIPFNCIQVAIGAIIAELLAKRIHI